MRPPRPARAAHRLNSKFPAQSSVIRLSASIAMEPTKQNGDPASSNPDSDLDAFFLERRRNPSSRQQSLYLGPTSPAGSSLHLSPPQASPREGVQTASPDGHGRVQEWWVGEPQPQHYGVGESSTRSGGGYVSPVGAGSPGRVDIKQADAHSPPFVAPAAPLPEVAPKQSKLSASEPFLPPAMSHPLVVQWSPTPSSIASQYQYQPSASYLQPGGAAVFPQWHYNGSLNPYGSALPSALPADQDGSQLWSLRFDPMLVEVRARLLVDPMPMMYVMSSQWSAYVVHLLAEGDEQVRLRVLDAVKLAVHSVMGSSEGHAVFLALLRACEGQFDELHGIAQAAASSNGMGFLMGVAKHVHGVMALKELIRAVEPYREPCQPLINCLLHERLMGQRNGVALLHHFFTTLPYEDCLIIIRFAIATLGDMLSSKSGSMCLMQCFDFVAAANSEELRAFEEIILFKTSVIAKGQYSNYFLQLVLERGSELLKQRITERVVEDLVSLSGHQLGNYVVQACFLRTGSCRRLLLRRVLTAFQSLGNDQLAELVKGEYANYVVLALLENGEENFPRQTKALAQQIKRLPAAVLDQMHATRVMRVVRTVLRKQPLHYPV